MTGKYYWTWNEKKRCYEPQEHRVDELEWNLYTYKTESTEFNQRFSSNGGDIRGH